MTTTFINQLYIVLKRRLKSHSICYKDISIALGLSEPSVKRRLSQENLTLPQLTVITDMMGINVSELMREAEEPTLHHLTDAQEKHIMSDPHLMLVFNCVLNRWSLKDIVENYDFTEPQCFQYLVELDQMRIIDLLPGNRIRLRTTIDTEARPGGLVQQYLRNKVMKEFFDSDFNDQADQIMFMRARLTSAALEKFHVYARNLKKQLVNLNEECLGAPHEECSNFVAFLSMRNEFEIDEFASMRRPQPEKV